MNDLEKFRIRWRRWLGQKCRKDKPYWTTLLNCNWFGWARTILQKGYMECPDHLETREGVKECFTKAIEWSDRRDLMKLDNLYCTEKMR